MTAVMTQVPVPTAIKDCIREDMSEAPQAEEDWRDSRHAASAPAYIHSMEERRGV